MARAAGGGVWDRDLVERAVFCVVEARGDDVGGDGVYAGDDVVGLDDAGEEEAGVGGILAGAEFGGAGGCGRGG